MTGPSQLVELLHLRTREKARTEYVYDLCFDPVSRRLVVPEYFSARPGSRAGRYEAAVPLDEYLATHPGDGDKMVEFFRRAGVRR